jgi:hypothetical protein
MRTGGFSFAPARRISLAFDPPLPAIGTAYTSEPLLTLFDARIKLASLRPCGHLDLDRRIDRTPVCFAVSARIEIHKLLEHAYDFEVETDDLSD